MRILIIVILSSFTFIFNSGVMGQASIPDKFDTTGNSAQTAGFDKDEIATYLQKKKLKVNMEIGTTFGTTFGSGSYFGTYLSPNISYPVSKRFTLSTGGYLFNTHGLNNPSDGTIYPYNPFSGGITRTFVYVEGAYQLNENITLTGAAYKEFNVFNTAPSSSSGRNFNYEGFIMGVDYKLGNNVFIRGQVEISNGGSPYQYSPLYPATNHRIHGTRSPFGPGF
jgi:hypothetical protein